MGHVPKEFQVAGPRPEETKKRRSCNGSSPSKCELPFHAHSGIRCAICKEAEEHHTAESFADCLAGRRRMARARFLADVELDEFDKASLADG